jgi:hypothetical protein
MTVKSAALIAFVGTILVAVLLVWNLIVDVLGVLRGLIPPVGLFSAFVYAFGAVTVALFFYIFQTRAN